jgi:hypothetical protein
MYATFPSIFKFVMCFCFDNGAGVLSGVLVMDDSKSKTKGNLREWAVIHYIFHIMYGKNRV